MNFPKRSLYRALGILVVFVTLGMVACASPPPELVEARQTYKEVAEGPAAEFAPAELQTAKEALKQAENAFDEEGDDPVTRALAYRAQRRAQLAATEADIFLAKQEKQAGEQALLEAYEDSRTQLKGKLAERREQMQQREQELAMERERLEASRQELQQARERGELTEQQLQEKRNALEQRQKALSQSEQQLAVIKTELENEREQRKKVEERLKQARKDLEEFAKVDDSERNMIITVPGEVLFQVGESDLRAPAKNRLNKVVEILLQDRDRKITVEGHTDSQGSDDMNLELSQKRAESVRTYFITQGIAGDRIDAVGRGEGEPVAPNDTPTGRASNRRVEIIVEGGGTAALEPAAEQAQE